ncbi:MAG: chemotaxis protein CheW [Leptospiraceae bacterium]|nr:chemotaxis protein CheW [Leptospiraceae bacterium]MCP5496574.1 chemotaxis protein CheW [Leptospiraceae bacterium]
MTNYNSEENQFLTFQSGNEVLGIDILYIKEIKEYHGLTTIPMVPDFIKGVINLRGKVVPIIDLSIRFGRKTTIITKKTCIVVVEISYEDEKYDVGILVDSVNEVLKLNPEDIEPSPSFGTNIRNEFIKGFGKIENSFIILLNIDKVLSISEISSMEDKIFN